MFIQMTNSMMLVLVSISFGEKDCAHAGPAFDSELVVLGSRYMTCAQDSLREVLSAAHSTSQQTNECLIPHSGSPLIVTDGYTT